MTRVIHIDQHGGPEVLRLAEIDLPPLEPDEVRMRHTRIGVNFADTYFRKGLYPLPGFPAGMGLEASGIVEAVGAQVNGFVPGDRVAYVWTQGGSYADIRHVPARMLLPVPTDLDDRQIGGFLLRGLTSAMLMREVMPLRPGQTVLIHAAAGGMGLILSQWASRLGAVVIGTAGSEAKAELARAHGVAHVILYHEVDFVGAVRDLTQGRGVDYVIDGIGGDTLTRSLAAARPFGTVASLGQVTGGIPSVSLAALNARYLIRPSISGYIADAAAYRGAAEAWFAQLRAGLLTGTEQAYPLEAAAQAQADMEAGRTRGGIVLIP